MSKLTDFISDNDDRIRTFDDAMSQLKRSLDDFDGSQADDFEGSQAVEHARDLCLLTRAAHVAFVEAMLFHDDTTSIERCVKLMKRVSNTLADSLSIAGDNEDYIREHIELANRIERDIADAIATRRARASPQHVFISYVSENRAAALRIKRHLARRGVSVWLDRERLKPGFRWKHAINKAISNGQYFLALFSRDYLEREKTYMNEELTLAIEEMRKRRRDRAWFIPVLLSPCDIPYFDIGAGESLDDIQYIDLSEDWSKGMEQLIDVIQQPQLAK